MPLPSAPFRPLSRLIVVAAFVLLAGCFRAGAQDGAKDAPRESKLRTVVIDPGHGGTDPGSLDLKKKVREKDVALAISLAFAKKLREECPDLKVITTRDTDKALALHQRADIANKAEAQLFISIHLNAATTESACGVQVYSLSPNRTSEYLKNITDRENGVIYLEEDYQKHYQGLDDSTPEMELLNQLNVYSNMSQGHEFAMDIYEQMKVLNLVSNRAPENRVLQSGFYVLRMSIMPSVLIEVGYITNPSLMNSEDGQEQIADALVRAVKVYRARLDGEELVLEPQKKDEAAADQQPKPEEKAEVKAEKAEKAEATAEVEKILYGVQVTAVGRKMDPKDRFFHGYRPLIIRAEGETLYKYVICTDESLDKAKASMDELKKKGLFKDGFLVKVCGDKISRVR